MIMAKIKTVENEIKLTSSVNTQLKLINIEHQQEILKKILFICNNLLGITNKTPEIVEITDEYYDTPDNYFGINGYSLRKRTQKQEKRENKYFLTIKSPHPAQNSTGLVRNEWELERTETEIENIIANEDKVADIIAEEFDSKLSISNKLIRMLTIKNTRTYMHINTNVASYILSIDKYYVYSATGDYSEYQFEIEIEKEEGLIESDEQVRTLHEAIKLLLNYEDGDKSKYKKASKFAKCNGPEMTQVFTLMFDIVSYSQKPAAIQKDNIQKLNRSVKQAVNAIFGANKHIPYLPTGDGLIIIFEQDAAANIPHLSYQIQHKMRETNRVLSDDKKVEFRMGIHVGNVFKYSDINDSLNFSGDGINKVERITNIGNAWQILATDDFYRYMRDLNFTGIEDFYDIGYYKDKHENIIKVYNIYNKNANIGNPLTPKKIINVKD